ncbi:ABC transporter ATP-binding protein [Leucobacter sp. CSA1]|uniref:Spermidine/putrescine import ATP-binding protein PotA n=1 Tax=Leucobacter chromiisoli TaxID=2796471 RepID=A0A934Q8Z6_9MICO|nr:ABC transporter ATP-binding protein [Leucobacter chromiisoli]MBK0420419.1 ABC transporter ATP-binding protein [Leucobacter chromiisoli]
MSATASQHGERPGEYDGVRARSTAIAVEGVSKRFPTGERDVLVDVDLTIGDGEFFSILGPSGCGKSTLLRILAGFERPSRGSVRLFNADVTDTPPNKRDLNLVFQSYALFPHLSVFGNIAFGLKRKRLSKSEIDARVREAVTLVELEGREEARPRELSGGQQQRVALARALVNRPRALLLDEPLAALDLKLRQAMQEELKRIQREVGITFVYVTHDQGEALALSDRLAVMAEGRLLQVGTPDELYERPSDPFVARFIGSSTLLEGVVIDGGSVVRLDGGDEIPLPAGTGSADGSRIGVVVRPERIRVSPDSAQAREAGGEPARAPAPGLRAGLRGTVEETEFLGPSRTYRIRTDGGAVVRASAPNSGPGDAVFAIGDRVRASWTVSSDAVVPL